MNVLLFCQYLPGGFLLFLPGPSLSLCLTCIELWALEQQGLQERAVEPRLCGGQGPVPEALGAPLRRFGLPGGGGQRGLHLGCREFVKQCVRETGLPPIHEVGWSLRPGAVRRNRSGGLAGISTAGRACGRAPVGIKGMSHSWRFQPGAHPRGERLQPLWGGVARG